ncbi:fibronectin type III domain-containing protein [Nonomuraea sp. SYSU D8015]|uniref:fibronectin type III domain-containing protein n=1 Tax=Nonomuraea sp. SYSU D8015 TaxID=2593644 RepID=UPI001CB6D1AF|nr:fibronectin type III domain-containing protein [Nonomuraea sp. SYSU D8015]
MGDSDDKGEIFETPLNITGKTFPNAIRDILGSGTAVIEGALYSAAGTYTGTHVWQSKRKAVDYVCQLFNCEWRVNGNATLDAGPAANLFATTPKCVIVRNGADGHDLALTGLPGDMSLARDVQDWTTRVVLLAEGQGEATATGSANIASNPYVDLRGQAVKRTRLVSESGTSTGNAQARAQLQLNRFSGTRNALRLSTHDYEVRGSFAVGDWVWVWDPDSGIVDPSVEVTFRGQRFNPLKLRVAECSWPVTEEMTVAYRHQDGTWHDLTPFVRFESGATSITVGELGRSLTNAGSEPVGPRPIPDSTIPGVVTWVTPFQTSVYLDGLGNTRARIIAFWQLPLNTDGSTILDGHHYEIGYGISPATSWEIAYAPWGDLQGVVNDLSPGVTYDFRIRAVDLAGNAGAWSATVSATANPDTIPPSTPAAPTVAGSRLALQISHNLGKSTGGTFNLEKDLQHLEIHVGATSGFTADSTTLKGKTPATAAMMQALIPAIATVEVEETTARWVRVIAVDEAGNRSAASASASATALLIDDAHISDLTVTKVTAGTISSNWLIGAEIRTASAGQRVVLNATGLHGFDSGNNELVSLLNTGSFTLRSAPSGSRVQLDTSGLKVFSGTTEVVSLLASGSFTLRSAASGARVELDTAGLRIINSGGTQLVNLASSGSFTLRSAGSGSRVELDMNGLRLYDGGGSQTLNLDATNGNVDMVGRLTSTVSGSSARLVINPNFGADPEIRFYENTFDYHYITSHVGAGVDAVQMGSVTVGDRKGLLQLAPGIVELIRTTGGATFTHTGLRVNDTWFDMHGMLGQPGNNSVWVRGSSQIGGFATGYTIFFGGTMDSAIYPVISFFDIGSNVYAAIKNGGGASSFGFLQSQPSSVDPHEVTYLGWRM